MPIQVVPSSRAFTLLAVLGLSMVACDDTADPVALDSASPADAAGSEADSGAPSADLGASMARIRERIGADARAFHALQGGFRADLPMMSARAQLSHQGVAFLDAHDDPLFSVRTVGFGRLDSVSAVDPTDPIWGACTTDTAPEGECTRTVELEAHDFVESWTGLDTGLAQEWTILVPPDGSDTLVMELELSGATLQNVTSESATLEDRAGRTWSIAELGAWDARGRALPVALHEGDGVLQVRVDDTDAEYPIVVDPVYTSAAWSALGGSTYYAYGEDTVASAGDVNGDGYDDLAISAYRQYAYTGTVYVYYGSSSGISTTADAVIEGESVGEQFGYAVASAGDVDNDGYGDLVVGADNGAFICFGSGSGIETTCSVQFHSGSVGEVASAGQVNTDNYDDVIISNQGNDVYVYFSSSSRTLSQQTHFSVSGTCQGVASAGDLDGDGFGDVFAWSSNGIWGYEGASSGVSTSYSWNNGVCHSHVALLGDVDRDGYDDLACDNGSGDVYIYYGDSTGPFASNDIIYGVDANFGERIAGGLDIDGDGYNDLIAWDESGGTHYYSLFDGTSSGINTTAKATINAPSGASSSWYGYVAPAGNLDGDGYDEFVVHTSSEAYVFEGSSSGITSSPIVSLTGPSDPEGLGYAVESLGDVDGDGYDDVAIGAYQNNSSTGSVYVYMGASSGLESSATLTLNGSAASDRFGRSLAGDCDLNGDGLGDLAVGATHAASSYGEVTVYRNTGSTFAASPIATLSGTSTSASFGYAIDCAGDVNADGYDDLIVGAYNESTNGMAYIFEGGSSGPSSVASASLSPTSTSDLEFGQDVAGVGDMNGDGYDDVVVAYDRNNTYGYYDYYESNAFGVPTSRSGSKSDYLSPSSSSSYRIYEVNVEGVGDIDGDGTPDLLLRGSYGAAWCSAVSGSCTTITTSSVDSIGAAGDVDADGYADVLVDDQLYVGSSTGVTYKTGFSSLRPQNNEPTAVGTAGDVNGDGYDDILVGYGRESAVFLLLGYADADGDGIEASEDCDDSDASVGAASGAWYTDSDGDGYGDSGASAVALCSTATTGYAASNDDCDDTDSAISPGATEVCDGVDNDCDGTVDTGVSVTYYLDSDGDGYGDAASTTSTACSPPSGYVTDATDCDDSNADAFPGNTEVCDGADNDCDGVTDGIDADGDGEVAEACGGPDCDDDDVTVNTSASETVGDGVDSDCDGTEVCYVDADGDGQRPDPTSTVTSTDTDCSDFGEALSTASTADCDDTDATIYDGASEVPGDEVDQDCDGTELCFVDADGDGYVEDSASTVSSSDIDCSGTGEATDSVPTGDCDDTDSAISPAATEGAGDGVDQDCDGTELCFVDADDDGYALDASSTVSSRDTDCTDSGEATDTDPADDCDDSDSTINPGASEIAGDEVDQNCDDIELCYADSDGDGYRTESSTVSSTTDTDCTDSGEAVSTAEVDCDDTDASVNPGASDTTGDGVDSDCDGYETCYEDLDEDGFGTSVTTQSTNLCADPGESLTDGGDCDDTDASINPGATELPGDEVDQNCDLVEWCYPDVDGDGDRGTVAIVSSDLDCDDFGEALATASEDCDDSDASRYSGATEGVGDNIDQNCDGEEICYVDADNDGYRTDDTVVSSDDDCDDTAEALAIELSVDCDDADASINQGATETVGNGIDEDCSGTDECYEDADGDGARTAVLIPNNDEDCDDAGEAYESAEFDCDDTVYSETPGGGEEIPGDGTDQDCDGEELCYVDEDGDGYPGEDELVASGSLDCSTGDLMLAPSDGVFDCDDDNAAINPGATEGPGDGIDQDCNGEEICYSDADGDSYRSDDDSALVTSTLDLSCDGPGEASAADAAIDCDDSDPFVSPAVAEIEGDEFDQNCDGKEVCYTDADGDGYRDLMGNTTNSSDADCSDPGEASVSTSQGDCDDFDPSVYPGATEIPGDGIDQDCRGGDAVADDGGESDDAGKGGGCASVDATPTLPVALLALMGAWLPSRRRWAESDPQG